MLDKNFQSVLDVFPYSTGSSEAVLGPPFGCLLDLSLGARLNSVGKCHG